MDKELHILSVVGARPNFMKIAPFAKSIKRHNEQNSSKVKHTLVHTGQHYDELMSDIFFETLGIPRPDFNLSIGSGSHGEQLGNTMIAFEKLLVEQQPDWVIVIGDVNATLSCSVIAKRLGIQVCHIESGLRSRDMRMPEEINRIVTDRVSDLLLTPDRMSSENLHKEGRTETDVVFVGNIMIDTLVNNVELSKPLAINEIVQNNLHEAYEGEKAFDHQGDYALLTLHRPSNVDDQETLSGIVSLLEEKITKELPMVFPAHPRTQKQLKAFGLWERLLAIPSLFVLRPLGYLELLRMNMDAKIFFTDSGGVQEECTYLGTPCITLRDTTERPITLTKYGGVSVLVGNDLDLLEKTFYEFMKMDRIPFKPEFWDGHTADRCLEAILNYN